MHARTFRFICTLLAIFAVSADVCFSRDAAAADAKKKKEAGAVLSFGLTPSAEFPIEVEQDLLGVIGPAGTLQMQVTFPKVPVFAINSQFSYTYLPVRADTSLSLMTLGAGPAANIEIAPRFLLNVYGLAGGFFGFFNDTLADADEVPYDNQQGFGLGLEAGVGFTFFVTPYLSLGLSGAYVNYVGLSHSVRACLGTTFHLSGVSRKVEVLKPVMDPVFPAYFKYYDARRIGAASIKNLERFPLTNVNVSFMTGRFMNGPRACASIPLVKPGGTADFDLFALFDEDVLGNKEDGNMAARIIVEYTLNGRKRTMTVNDSVRMRNRNGITWDDDRKAAAFVNPKAPEVLSFSKNIAGIVGREGPAAVNRNLRLGMALFEALGGYGINYVVDPNTPSYEEASENAAVVDFLQYPNQTLSFKAGDCDDLSILYASLLESVGVDTAFVTVPGHIYAAFSLGVGESDAARLFSTTEDLILKNGTAWVPVEVTMVGVKGFLEAWKQGALSWRDNERSGKAGFYPMKESWSIYTASGFPRDVKATAAVDVDAAAELYRKQLARYVSRDLEPQIAAIKEAMGNDTSNPKLLNRIGVLYAMYGRERDAEDAFQKILSKADYVPALINLGNLCLLLGRADDALKYLAKADELKPGDAGIFLNLAMTYYEKGLYPKTRELYAKAKAKNADLAERYAFLGSSEAPSKAAEAATDLSRLYWETE